MAQSIFLVGTDTDVGKTYVAGLLAKKLKDLAINVGYYKAALSGGYYAGEQLIPGDAEYVLERAGIEEEFEKCVSYTLEHAVSPHLAARLEGVKISLDRIKADYETMAQKYDCLVVEGSGGVVCPLRLDEQDQILLEDVIKRLDLPVVIVARAGLGTINHTVLTVSYLNNIGIAIKGIILNEYEPGNMMHEDNKLTIEKLTGIPIIEMIQKHSLGKTIKKETINLLFNK